MKSKKRKFGDSLTKQTNSSRVALDWEIIESEIFKPPIPNRQDTRPFLTGSRAYGTPRNSKEDASDVDIVVLVSSDLQLFLDQFSVGKGSDQSTRFGVLNLIAVTSLTEYRIWKYTTLELIKKKPVCRAKAIEVFKEVRELVLSGEYSLRDLEYLKLFTEWDPDPAGP